MNQSNLFQRQCPKHPEQQVIYACYNKSCKLNRLVCKNCMKLHSDHADDLLNEQEIQEKMKESSINCQSQIKQLNKMFNEIQLQFKQLISSLESQYIFSIQSFNTMMDNKQLNIYINELVLMKDKENTLNQLFTQGLNSFKEQINQCLNNLNLYEQQQKVFSKEEMEMVEMYFKQGYEYGKMGDHNNAIKMFDQALLINQNHIKSLFCKGESLRWMDQLKESIEWYDKALEINPQYTFALYGKGDSLKLMNQFKESIEWSDRALAINPLQTDALFGKGESLRMFKQYNEALKYLNSALYIDGNYEQCLGSKGACLIELGKLDEAEKCLNLAIKLNSNNQFNYYQLNILKEKRAK